MCSCVTKLCNYEIYTKVYILKDEIKKCKQKLCPFLLYLTGLACIIPEGHPAHPGQPEDDG